jgi:hypothetical protein
MRQLDLVERIHVKIFFRSDVGAMRAIEANAQEKGPIFVLLHQLNRPRRGHSVGLLFIGALGGEPAEGAAEAALWSDID